MNKLKTHYFLLSIIAAYFLFNGCIDRTEETTVQYGETTFYSYEAYAADLESEGYSEAAAAHIAKVEFKILPIDQEYTALIED